MLGKDLVAYQHTVCADCYIRPCSQATSFRGEVAAKGTTVKCRAGAANDDDALLLTFHSVERFIPTFAAKRDAGPANDRLILAHPSASRAL